MGTAAVTTAATAVGGAAGGAAGRATGRATGSGGGEAGGGGAGSANQDFEIFLKSAGGGMIDALQVRGVVVHTDEQ